MIFQIDYKSGGKYDDYFEHNRNSYSNINYMRFHEQLIDDFLKEYRYFDLFNNLVVHKQFHYAHNAILCDALRLMILYELGGTYIDADVIFTKNVSHLEEDLCKQFDDKTIVLSNRSLYFISAPKRAPYVKHLLDKYLTTDYLTLDIFMNRRHFLTKFHNEIAIVDHEFLTKYFKHEQVTTDETNKHRIRI